MSAPKGCERNLAAQSEDCGHRIAYHPCGKPVAWNIEPARGPDWGACEEHAREYFRDIGVDCPEELEHAS